jgi:amino acid adenylation domain-containing protein
VDVITKQKITTLHFVPSMLRAFLEADGIEACTSLKRVVCSGEALPSELQDRFFERLSAELHNLYGPTEASVDVTYWQCTPDNTRSIVPIGKPVWNTTIYILDKHLEPVPVGVAGELHIGGVQLASGYLKRPELTQEKFIPDPFSSERGARLYKTGDLTRFLADGNIEYLGRLDHQVKIRGFRIELGEIEAALDQHPAVSQSVVMAREDKPGEKRLAAYVALQPGKTLTMTDMRAHLTQSLPEYMVPGALVTLDSLPLNPNGKVDRKRLPVPDYSMASAASAAVQPRNPTEEIVAGIWAELLEQPSVGVTENFFDLGGHSLLATRVVSRVRQIFEIELPLRTLFEAPTVSGLGERIDAVRKQGIKTLVPPITRASRQAPIPASFAQQRLWFLDQLDPGNPVFNLPHTLYLEGRLDDAALEKSFNAVAERQESLRTSFALRGDDVVQVIHESVHVPFRKLDLSHLVESGQKSEALRLIAEDVSRGFDLAQAPLLRVLLVRLSAERHYLLLNVHHIISDRWSTGLLLRELVSFYRAYTEGSEAPGNELPLQYTDYTMWQRMLAESEEIKRQVAYWKKELDSAPQLLELPTDHPRPATESSRGDVTYLTLPRTLAEKINNFSREHGSTLFMTLLAGFQALLSRYSGQDDIVVGTGIANRTHPQLEEVVGYFLNTLALRSRMKGDPSFAELVRRAKKSALEAYVHQDVPFEKLVEELRPERSLSHSPLVQVFFILQNAPMQEWNVAGLRAHHVPSGMKTAKGDLYLSMEETKAGLEARLEYNTDLFESSTAEKLLQHLQVLLEAAVTSPSLKLSQLPLLTESEHQQIVVDWNATTAEYERDLCLHELIERQASSRPDAVACIQPGETPVLDRSITYGELNERANQVARNLRSKGVGNGQLVGIFVDRSIEMMVGLLGIQKAGAAYVPLDPAYPAERIRLTLEDAQVPVLLTQASLRTKLPQNSAQVICLDRDWPVIARESTENLGRTASPDDLVYVIFTSGSTGRPKGVQIPHRAAVNLLTFMQHELEMGPHDVFPALASFAFDMCIPELYLALVSGGKVVIGAKDLAANGEELAALLRRTGATVVHATPTTWRLLLEAGFTGKGLKRAIGAEPLPRELCQQLLDAEPSLYNFYGPTETTVWSTWHHFASAGEPIVVGRPIANTQVYILDQNMHPLPAGLYGEIYIAGDGVAHGYLNRPELTSERFVPNPFSGKPGAKMYRTGDLGRYLADGRIEFQGRADHQVKVRGYRIELGEIEAVIEKHPAVQQAVVIVREDVPADKRLVAYVCAKPGHEADDSVLRDWVNARLPEYMFPVAWVLMEKLPLSPNGKVDRRNLPAPEYLRSQAQSYSAPRSPDEEVIAGIWCEVLKFDRVGIHDNFFELGGHSLLATRVVARIRQALSVDLPVRSLFEEPTVAGLAETIRSLLHKNSGIQTPVLQRIAREQMMPLSFAQQRMWFLDQLEPGTPLYNVAYVTRLTGELNAGALEKSLNEIVRRHETLRTTFVSDEGQPSQQIAPELSIPLVFTDVSHSGTSEECEAQARKMAAEEVQQPFNLSTGPLIRGLLLKIGQNDHALVITMHHIITDRWSLGVFSHELAALYEATLLGKPSPLLELAIQYVDYAAWQRKFLSSSVLENQLAYWRQQLDGAPAVLELPTDRPRSAGNSFWGAQVRQIMPSDLSTKIKLLSRREHATFYMTLLATFHLLMGRLAGQNDVVIGTDLANRTQLETEKLIGFFVNLLPMRAKVEPSAQFTNFLREVRESSLQAMANQDIPFEKLVEELRPERKASHNPLVQVLLVMQNTPPMVQQFAGLELKPLGVSSSSRFDLVMFVNDPDTSPSTTWMYNPNLFDASTIERIAELYRVILAKVCEQPEINIQALFRSLDEWEAQAHTAEQKKFEASGREKLRKARRKAVEA